MRAAVDRDAVVVGLTLVPGLISRNRSYALFEDPEMRRARVRSALLRGIVRQLSGGQGQVEAVEVVSATGGRELRYRLPGLRVHRRAVLSDVEYACIAYLAGRANVSGLQASDEDRTRIDAALRRLSAGLKVTGIDGFEDADDRTRRP
ncbi:MAG: hypothetical protein ABSF69_04930 [Polyangiaceae bacterium]|jgi:hypothetical protein